MRIATWNVNSLNARLDRVEAWLAALQPDVVCLQETKLTNDAFPGLTFEAMGYSTAHHGQGQWNGVAILSRVGLDDVRVDFDDGGDPDPDARVLWATCDGIRVASCYVPNGRSLDDDHYQYKLSWLERLRVDLDRNAEMAGDVMVLGDFNIAPDDRDVWDPAVLVGATHGSKPERAALAALCDLGLSDVFREHHHEDGLFSWWDYRDGNFHKRRGMRIDLALVSASVSRRTKRVFIDRSERKGKLPSDHAPLVVDLAPRD